MRRYLLITMSWGFWLCSSSVIANTAPTVTNVTASQRTDGSGVVDISYTLTDADNDKCSVSVVVSNDRGNTWAITPSSSALSGDRTDVSPGRRKISWASKVNLPGALGSNYRVKITANDNYGPSGMVWICIDDPGVSGHEGFNGYMSKYEITNAQYCQYLNAAKASGDINTSGNYVLGASGTNSGTDHIGQYYYNLAGPGSTSYGASNGGGVARVHLTGNSFIVDSGFENHPVTYVSWYGAIAFASYYGWRLPTEWEWQAVADNTEGAPYIYGCGISISNSMANYRGSTHPDGTTPVGQFGTYGYGIADMAGNVWEWTSSVSAGSSPVLRGGSWYLDSSNCQVSKRDSHNPDAMHYDDGFRVCRDILNDRFVAYYKLENSTSSIVDEMGKNSGTNYGAISVAGKVGKGLYFDGINDYINVPVGFSTNDVKTISLWFKTDTNQTNANLYCNRYTTGGDNDRGLLLTSNRISYARYDTVSGWTANYDVDYSDGNWHNVVTVETSTGAGLYYDGVLRGTSSTPFNFSLLATRTIPFGVRYNNTGKEAYFKGSIDEIKLWNRELSSSEIQSLYLNP